MTALPWDRCKWYFDISIDKIPIEQRVQAIKTFEKATGAEVWRDYRHYHEDFRILEWNTGSSCIDSSWSYTRKSLDEYIDHLKKQEYRPFTVSITLGELWWLL